MNEVKINEIPSLTWNWMKINRDAVTLETSFKKAQPEIRLSSGAELTEEAGLSPSLAAKFSECGSGVFNKSNPKLNAEKNGEEEAAKLAEKAAEWENHPVNRLIEEITEKGQTITLSGKVSEPVIISFTENQNTACCHNILAKADSEAAVIFVYSAKDDAAFNQLIKTRIYAEENAKLHIVKVQLNGKNALQLDDTAICEMDNANVKFTQIELGGAHTDSGLHVNLKGYKSSFESNVAYICAENQKLDMNHIVYHFGQKSECNMKVNGTLKDEAQKTYRGTIDFKKGCSASVGHELEETLLLNPKVVNKSLPVILCDEEDVEGTHGATIGHLSGDILFYMQTRGISQAEAEKLMSRAKVQAVADLIPSEEVRSLISGFISE